MNEALASQPVVKKPVSEDKVDTPEVSKETKEVSDKTVKVAPEEAAKNLNNPVAGLEADDKTPKKVVRRRVPRVKKEEVVEA
jgi:hypothetical protein